MVFRGFPETLKQLLNLLADGEFHSGTELSLALGISRSAVWKQLQSLPELGVELNAVSGKGYKLQEPLQLLDQSRIFQSLSQEAISLLKNLEIHDAIHSTNSYLLELARIGGGASGTVCLAEYQSGGKGRRDRQWISPFGQNIYVSILWRYQDGPAAIAGLSLALGVAVVRALQEFGLKDIGLKWPNDILWDRRKLAGILVEVSGESGGPCYAVIGLGVNFYLPPRQAENIDQPWVDIYSVLGSTAYVRRNEFVGMLLNRLLPVIAHFKTAAMQKYADEWRHFDCMCGQTVNVYTGQRCFQGMVAGIDDEGLLLLNTGDGGMLSFASGEVSFRAL